MNEPQFSSPDDAIEQVHKALDRGELFGALDLARAGLAAGAGSDRLTYLKARALADTDDAHGALAALDALENPASGDEDSLALRGRILKDIARNAPQAERKAAFAAASEVYRTAHERTGGGYFSLINAATTARLAGLHDEARIAATQALADPKVAARAEFWEAATAVEALALLDRFAEAGQALADACALPDAKPGARASTTRQMVLLAAETGDPRFATLADAVRPANVLFYAGHMFHIDPAAETRIAEAIERMLDETGCTIAFGGAAAGADILFAEAILRRKGELHLVLPFHRDDYLRQSVAPWGDGWGPRFERIMAAARAISYASAAPYIGDPLQFAFGSQFAMGLTCLRAEHLCTGAFHAAVAEGTRDRGLAGTQSGIGEWQASGRKVITIPSGPIDRSRQRAEPGENAPELERESRSIIFTDYSKFSRIDERALPRFLREVMRRIGDTLDEHGDDVLCRNTWGDALYAIVRDPAAAADLALAIQESLTDVDPTDLGLPADAGMRIALHHGPVYSGRDPVTGLGTFFGSEVTRTARIEPITPVGEVYATEPLAAMLALNARDRFTTRYVGLVQLHKDFGAMPMHQVTRSTRSQ